MLFAKYLRNEIKSWNACMHEKVRPELLTLYNPEGVVELEAGIYTFVIGLVFNPLLRILA